MTKKICFVLAAKDFRDEEFFVPKEILEKAGAKIKTASNKSGAARGAEGNEAVIDLLVKDVNPADFDVVVFIGGPGTLENLDNAESYNLIQKTITSNKILAAICIAPIILAKAGALKDKQATVWSSALDQSPIKILEQNGARFLSAPIVADGKIITANGPGASKEFAEKILDLLLR